MYADGRPIALGGRAFDLLIALIEASGGVVCKDQLLTRAWPDRVVEDPAAWGDFRDAQSVGADPGNQLRD